MKMLFVCGVCGEIYESEAEAKHCEKGHKYPKEVQPCIFYKHQVYPDRIKVRFDNITAVYKYESGLPIIGCSTKEN